MSKNKYINQHNIFTYFSENWVTYNLPDVTGAVKACDMPGKKLLIPHGLILERNFSLRQSVFPHLDDCCWEDFIRT